MHASENKQAAPREGAGARRFQYSVENLRGLAILFVVLSHITSLRAVGPAGQYLSFVFQDATAWFVFISGYLFNHVEQARFNYRDYLRKKAKFVILPYLVLSVPAIIVGIAFNRHVIMGLSPEAYSLWSLVVGGAVIVPMWFIPMIALFFLASPLFHQLRSAWAQALLAVAGLALSLFTARPVDNLNPFLSFGHFAGFYLLGILFSAQFREFKHLVDARLMIVLSLLLFVATSCWHFALRAEPPLGFFDGVGRFDLSLFGKLTLLVAVFHLFDRYIDVPNRFLGWLADISFGIFFLHGFFMALSMKLGQRLAGWPPQVMLALELALVLGGAMLAVLGVKRILGKRSRYVIGC